MTRVDLNVLSSFAADMESDPSVTINGLKPLSFRHRDGSTLAKTRRIKTAAGQVVRFWRRFADGLMLKPLFQYRLI
ncbi:hypothetical protein Bca52824_082187 [Brassica carinata]|uniref:Uncharacterized protein n=1 Tax=Brassica carinata TaxID=52824 RepID=A0A8X7TTY8_BRACI|nr:hypothetical protein Bca52824_082187 [Brassica carinata]